MKNQLITLLFICFLLPLAPVFGQASEPIEITEKGLFKKKVYTKCDIDMTPTQLITLFKNDPNMEPYTKKIAVNYLFNVLLSTTGSILVLLPVTESFYSDGDPNWNLAYIGAGCALLAIPFQKAFEKNAEAGINYYNSGYKKASRVKLGFQSGKYGVGLVLKF